MSILLNPFINKPKFQSWTEINYNPTYFGYPVAFDGIGMSSDGNKIVLGGSVYNRVGVGDIKTGPHISTDGGERWSAGYFNRFDSSQWRFLEMTRDGSKIYLSGSGISLSTDNLISDPYSNRIYNIRGEIAVSDDGMNLVWVNPTATTQIQRSTNGGINWFTDANEQQWIGVAISSDGIRQTLIANRADVFVRDIVFSSYNNVFTITNTNVEILGLDISMNGQYQTIIASGSILGSSGIYTSSDYGQNWTYRGYHDIQAVGIAISNNGDLQKIITSDRKIFGSSNYGQTWSQISVIPIDPSPSRGISGFSMSGDAKKLVVLTIDVFDSTKVSKIYINNNYGI